MWARQELARDEGEPILDAQQRAKEAASQSGKKGARKAVKKAAPSQKQANNDSADEVGSELAQEENYDYTVEEMALFKPAPRETEADRTGNERTTQRRLAESLFLVVKKPRTAHAWQFPQGGFEAADGDLLRATAERELHEECGPLQAHFYGHAPMFHYSYLFADDARSDCDGTKVFCFPAVYEGGDVVLDTAELEDYAWLTKEELCERVAPSLADNARRLLR